jgi:hypothetical protein
MTEMPDLNDLPVPKISQSLNVKQEDFIEFDRIKGGFKKSKTKKHKHIDFYYSDSFLKKYFNV